MLTTEHTQLVDTVIQMAQNMETYSPTEAVTGASRFDEDLGIDSLAMIDFVVTLEKRFAIVIDEAAITEVKTVDDMAKVINATLNA